MILETATIVWGRSYIEDFFNLSLKSLLTEENIFYINNRKLIINVIFKESEKELVNSFLKDEKSKYINIIFYSDKYFVGNKYMCHSNIIKFFIKDINEENYIFFFYPDMILSKNFLKNILKYEKYDLVFFLAPRVIKEKFLKNFDQHKISLGISEDHLNEFIINNLHIKMKLMTINSKFFNGAIGWLIQKEPNGLIIKSFHHTPVIIKKKIINTALINTNVGIDDYLSDFKLTHKAKIIESSQDISWCSLEEDEPNLYIEANFKYESVFKWLTQQTTSYQKINFVKFTTYFGSSDKSLIDLKKVSYNKNFVKVINQVKYFKIIKLYLKFISPLKYLNIIKLYPKFIEWWKK